MPIAYIGFGSNLGESLAICRQAIAFLDEKDGIKVEAVSSFFTTEPVGFETQPPFTNGVARVRTSLNPGDLFSRMQGIEQQLGRITKFKWGPRYIDLDLLLYDNQVLDEEELIVPHPLMHQRRFVLEPLAEIAAEVCHPGLGKTIIELLQTLQDDDKKVERLTAEDSSGRLGYDAVAQSLPQPDAERRSE